MARQEGVLEGVMQGEIYTLRRAHEVACDMARAEEGRARLYSQANQPQPHQTQTPPPPPRLSSLSSPSLSSLPPPPRYEEEIAGEVVVVNGFSGLSLMYMPSGTGSTPDTDSDVLSEEDTPESSVVDCGRTRVSVDTEESE